MADYTREEVVAKIAAGESLEHLDLAGIDLRGANLNEANFSKADLSQAKLNGANLNKANFICTDLEDGSRGLL